MAPASEEGRTAAAPWAAVWVELEVVAVEEEGEEGILRGDS